ncbi:MAG: hypothetical protein K0M50_02775 [Prolixibacteraceae bacterium]|nr:hypothetical protein [Prolixibacteraceae bacterium]
MKISNVLLILVFMILMTACNNRDKSKKDKEIVGQTPMWDYDCDSISKLKNVNADTLTYAQLIKGINDKYLDQVFLEFVKVSHDTIFVAIKNSTYLTQQMGTCGANQYMISTTFALTELNDIKNVAFDFVAGDHAWPGINNRESYWYMVKHKDRLNHE